LEFGETGGIIGGEGAWSGSMKLILGAGYAVIGLALIYWAAPLSNRYNTWTTHLRERHPNFNPPPTPEWRARNTKIMTVIIRVAGVFFVLFSIFCLLPLIGSTQGQGKRHSKLPHPEFKLKHHALRRIERPLVSDS
jgi:hypothetical protein